MGRMVVVGLKELEVRCFFRKGILVWCGGLSGLRL